MSIDTPAPTAERVQRATMAPARPRRRPWLIAAGLLMASVGALSVVWLVGAAGERQEVLVARNVVEYGQVVQAEDLAVARVSVDPGVAVVPAAERNELVGLVATTRLTPGAVLSPDQLEVAGEPAVGRVLVPVAIPAERMPAGGLRAGDRLVAIDAEADEGTGSGISATVVRVGAMDVNGVTVVDVTTAAPDGTALAVAAANGHVALVLQPRGQ